MTNKEAADRYQKLAESLAVIHGQLEDLYDTAEFLRERLDDNGDPEYALKQTLWWLGKATANAVSYAADYREAKEGEVHPDGTTAG